MKHPSIIALSLILTVLPPSIIHQLRGQGARDMMSVLSAKEGRQLCTIIQAYTHSQMALEYECLCCVDVYTGHIFWYNIFLTQTCCIILWFPHCSGSRAPVIKLKNTEWSRSPLQLYPQEKTAGVLWHVRCVLLVVRLWCVAAFLLPLKNQPLHQLASSPNPHSRSN